MHTYRRSSTLEIDDGKKMERWKWKKTALKQLSKVNNRHSFDWWNPFDAQPFLVQCDAKMMANSPSRNKNWLSLCSMVNLVKYQKLTFQNGASIIFMLSIGCKKKTTTTMVLCDVITLKVYPYNKKFLFTHLELFKMTSVPFSQFHEYSFEPFKLHIALQNRICVENLMATSSPLLHFIGSGNGNGDKSMRKDRLKWNRHPTKSYRQRDESNAHLVAEGVMDQKNNLYKAFCETLSQFTTMMLSSFSVTTRIVRDTFKCVSVCVALNKMSNVSMMMI